MGHSKTKTGQLPSLPRIPKDKRTPLVSSLLKLAIDFKARARRSQNDLKKKTREFRDWKKNMEDIVLNRWREKLDPKFMKILECQLRNAGKNKHAWRYTKEEKVVFLGTNKKGPSGYYSFPCIKPSRQCISRMMKKLNFVPGINPNMEAAFKVRIEAMDLKDREVMVCFDEMALKVNFTYDALNDKIVGFVDLGNGIRLNFAGEEAFVVMIRSIYGQWKQPYAFYFTHRKLTGADITPIFTESLKSIMSTGAVVRAIITDGLSKNGTATEYMGATLEDPWFFINGQKIYRMYDVPHLLKSYRNAFLKYILHLGDGTCADFAYLEAFIRHNLTVTPRIVKKMTEAHLKPNNFQKMSVPLAAQLISGTNAAGVCTYTALGALDAEAMVTGKHLEQMNQLFDLHNGIEVMQKQTAGEEEPTNFKVAISDASPHMDFWNKMYPQMSQWQFLGSTNNITFIGHWMSTIRAQTYLWLDIKAEGQHDYLPLGHLNSDCLENFNARTRDAGGHRKNPDAKEYPSAFATATINNMTCTIKGKNCRDDNALNIVHLSALMDAAEKNPIPKAVQEESIVSFERAELEELDEEEDEEAYDTEDEDQEPLPAFTSDADLMKKVQEKLSNIAGAQIASPIINGYLKKWDCEGCKTILLSEIQFPLHLLQTMGSGNVLKSLHPSPRFSSVVTSIFKAAEKTMDDCFKNNILANFMQQMEKIKEIREFQLCDQHQGNRNLLLKTVGRKAIEEIVVLSLNQNFKEKRRQKKSAKLQNVKHL